MPGIPGTRTRLYLVLREEGDGGTESEPLVFGPFSRPACQRGPWEMVGRPVGLAQPYVLRKLTWQFLFIFSHEANAQKVAGRYQLGRQGRRQNASHLRGRRSCAQGKPEKSECGLCGCKP